jgi:TetR/AcrR family transcriptional regulator, transcriptional repressor for nem operon
MPKHSHKEQILAQGMRVVHEFGYTAASVRDIVKAAGVPQGSFTNHFASKEIFGLEVLERYFARTQLVLGETLLNETLPPIKRLRAYVESTEHALADKGMRNGCLIGNLSIDASEHSELIRVRLVEIFEDLRQAVAHALRAAVRSGDLPPATECGPLADFFLSSLQGATLRAKAERSGLPIKVFKKIVFATLLAPPATAAMRARPR